MNYESKAWAETKGACLRNFNAQGDIDMCQRCAGSASPD